MSDLTLKERFILGFQFFIARKMLLHYFSEKKPCYMPDDVFYSEINLLTVYCIDPDGFEWDYLLQRYRRILPAASRRVLYLYRSILENDHAIGFYVFSRVCLNAGKCRDIDDVLRIHISDECCQETANHIQYCINRTSDLYFDSREKLSLSISFAAELAILLIPFLDCAGYYTFLRFLVFSVYVLNFFGKYSIFQRVIFLIFAFLFNPVTPVHLKIDIWLILDLLSLFLIPYAQISRLKAIIRKQ